jgi:hypothetical protein
MFGFILWLRDKILPVNRNIYGEREEYTSGIKIINILRYHIYIILVRGGDDVASES